MPKATLTFTLPDENHEFQAAIRGREALAALWEIDQHCRSLLKHGEPGDEAASLAEHIRQIVGDLRDA